MHVILGLVCFLSWFDSFGFGSLMCFFELILFDFILIFVVMLLSVCLHRMCVFWLESSFSF